MGLGDVLKEAGPYSTPLALGMGMVIRWLLVQNAALKGELAKERAISIELRERRADDLADAAREYAQIGEATRNVMREWTTRAGEVLSHLRNRLP